MRGMRNSHRKVNAYHGYSGPAKTLENTGLKKCGTALKNAARAETSASLERWGSTRVQPPRRRVGSFHGLRDRLRGIRIPADGAKKRKNLYRTRVE